jgi:hypothetical protein
MKNTPTPLERISRTVEQQVGLVEEEHQLGPVQVADLGQGLEQLGQQPHHEGREHPRTVGHVGQLQQGHDALARGVGAQQVVDVEGGLAEQPGHPLLLEFDQLAQQHPQGRLGHPAQFGHGRLAFVGAEELQHLAQVLEVDQQQPARVGPVEDEAEHAGLDVVEVQHLGQQGRPELRHRGPHRHPLGRIAGQGEQLDGGGVRVPGGLELLDAGGHLVGGLARLGHARHVPLHVGHEAGHAGVRQPPGQALDGLGLAGPGGPGDQPVAVQHGQRHGHLEAGVDLVPLDRPAERHRRLGEPVASGQPGKPFVHPPSSAPILDRCSIG